jgi:hypothetical protein
MRKKMFLRGIIGLALVFILGFSGCKSDDDGGSGGGGGSSLDGTWSQNNNSAIRFSGGNLQTTADITSNNVNWTLAGTYTYNSPTLTVTPPPENGVVQNAVQGTAVINGIQLTISGFPQGAVNALNGSWTKQ